MARTVTVKLLADASQMERSFRTAGNSSGGFGDKLKKASFIAAGALGALGVAAKLGFGELAESQKVAAQTAAVLKSTGGAAGVTAKQIEELAGSLSRKSGVDDEAIQSGQNLLLTFTNLQNKVGKGNDIFNQATKTMLDMSVALGTDAKGSALQLGKALNDPVKGITALTRVGVSFTEGQKKQIKAMADSGNTMGAQKLILAELNKEFGGSAKAAGETFPGQLNKLKNSFEEMAANLTASLLPALQGLTGVLSRATAFMQEHQTAAKAIIVAIAGIAATVVATNAAMKLYAAASVIVKAATVAWAAVQWVLNAALTANPIGVVVVAIAALVAGVILAWRHSETFRKIVTGAFDAVKGAASAVLGFFKSNWPIIATLISGPFFPIVALATDAFGIRSKTIAAFTAVKNWVSKNWPEIVTLISGPFFPIVALATDAFGVRSAMVNAFGAIKRAVVGTIDSIADRLRWLANNAGQLATKFLKVISGPLEGVIGLFQRLFDIVIATRNAVFGLLDKLGSVTSRVGGFISGIGSKIPGRQHGGPVERARSYIVGEAGPELFVPRTAGRVIPNGIPAMVGGGGGGVVNYYMSAPNYVGSVQDLMRAVKEASDQHRRDNGRSPW